MSFFDFEKGSFRPSGLPLLGLSRGRLHGTFSFDETCLYKPLDREHDWNKLVGFSTGFLPKQVKGKWKPYHHYNSFRLAWRPYVVYPGHMRGLQLTSMGWGGMIKELPMPREIELAVYYYRNGLRTIVPFGVVRVEEEYRYSIEPTGSQIAVSVFNEDIKFNHTATTTPSNIGNLGYLLGPYFGGTNPAPQDMSLYLEV